MIVAFSVAPASADPDEGMSAAVAEAIRVVRESGLPNETNSMFTLVEGEWDEVMDVVKRATEAVSSVAPRTSLVLKADIRPGYEGQLAAKVDAVERRLSE
ncbi:thiamine-binding protein [uncultured Corynebacterium sp.]|uniref:thiamine-binding protein n=1 Tax=uncultured Corynebacterium sp. TaxID=159447 RepID=UPI0025E6555F|nr:thiamine-binding protein [uncultured Corynebacterium sp.]